MNKGLKYSILMTRILGDRVFNRVMWLPTSSIGVEYVSGYLQTCVEIGLVHFGKSFFLVGF